MQTEPTSLSIRDASRRLAQFSAFGDREPKSAFVLIFLPDRGSKPHAESHFPLSDPYFVCGEAPDCECPYENGNLMWKIQCIGAGGVFDGRVSGQLVVPPLGGTGPNGTNVLCPSHLVGNRRSPDPAGPGELDDDDDEVNAAPCPDCIQLRQARREQRYFEERNAEYERNAVRPLELQGPAVAFTSEPETDSGW